MRACIVAMLAVILNSACASSGSMGTGSTNSPPLPTDARDVTRSAPSPVPGLVQDPAAVPPGFGTLRQDDIAIRLALPGGLQVRAMPLDESYIRLLSPDSYRAMRELIASKQTEIDRLQERVRLPAYALWLVNFFAQEQGETRFSPMEIVIRNGGLDFRPLDAFGLTPGFGEYRLRQRETQSALFVFDGQVNPNQPLSIIVETAESSGWQTVLQRVERERALIRSRASAQQRRDSTSGGTR